MNLSVDLIEFQPLTREATESGRMYTTPSGEKYPSVTTILAQNEEKKKSLAAWRRRVGTEEADRISGNASRRGTAVHNLMEDYVLNRPSKPAMPDQIMLFNQVKKQVDDNVTLVRGVESPLYSHRLRVAGTCDLIAEWQSKLSIIDYKTSTVEKKEQWIRDYFLQATLYSCMLQEMTGLVAKRLVVLIATQDLVDAQVFVKDRDEYIEEAVHLCRKYHNEIFQTVHS